MESAPGFSPAAYPISGILLGTLCAERLADAVADDPILTDGYAAVLCLPISDKSVEQLFQKDAALLGPVSYTHLTLPTICSV